LSHWRRGKGGKEASKTIKKLIYIHQQEGGKKKKKKKKGGRKNTLREVRGGKRERFFLPRLLPIVRSDPRN